MLHLPQGYCNQVCLSVSLCVHLFILVDNLETTDQFLVLLSHRVGSTCGWVLFKLDPDSNRDQGFRIFFLIFHILFVTIATAGGHSGAVVTHLPPTPDPMWESC